MQLRPRVLSLQDAEAMKNRLEMMKQKKSILTAEVRYSIYVPHVSTLFDVA